MLRMVFICALFAPSTLAAHPHIFIDTSLRVEVNAQGEAVAVEVTWGYDSLYSLLILEEFKLDPDYDGILEPDELEKLTGFDLNWVEGFKGDTYVLGLDGPIPLDAPTALPARYEEGQIFTSHRRTLKAPAAGLTVQAYDPSYYTLYELTGGVKVDGPCTYFIDPADFEAAMTALEELMFATPERNLDDDFPAVGANFADTVTLTCE